MMMPSVLQSLLLQLPRNQPVLLMSNVVQFTNVPLTSTVFPLQACIADGAAHRHIGSEQKETVKLPKVKQKRQPTSPALKR